MTLPVQRIAGGPRRAGEPAAWLVLILLALGPAAGATRGASPAELLEQAIYTEETKGELRAAGQLYQQIVDDPAADRSLVAQAQLRLGLCELKLGDKPRAISALERLTREFPDNNALLALIEPHMPRLLDDIGQQIEQNYLKEVDRGELMGTAIQAIVGRLDPAGRFFRSNDMAFLSATELTQANESIQQKIGGIGVMLKVDDATHEVVVGTPLPGSPALRGGLRAGDRVLEIEGNGLPRGKELETAVKLLRGAPGSAVSLAVKRAGSDRLLGIELVRDTVRLQSVKGDRYKEDATWEFMLDEQRKIGYVRLTQVGNQSAKEMEAALLELKERGIKALILDLRNNPGGTLDGAVAVADLFVENGTIVTVKGRTGEQRYEAEPEGTFSGFAMALLVNRNTASAAEIIAACLQDHQRALVVGERTFGQAIVRSLFTLRGGAGALKLPVAAYYRPSGKTMNRYPDSKDSEDWGVQPRAEDEVRFTDDELRQYEKYRAERDILNNPEPLKLRFEDAQLRRALEAVLQPRRSD